MARWAVGVERSEDCTHLLGHDQLVPELDDLALQVPEVAPEAGQRGERHSESATVLMGVSRSDMVTVVLIGGINDQYIGGIRS